MRAIIIGSVWVPLSISIFVLFPNVYVLIAVIVPMMVFLPTTNATVIGYRVAVVPDRLTGRVNSAARTIALCGAPLGPLSAGLLLSATSPRLTIAAYSLFLVVPLHRSSSGARLPASSATPGSIATSSVDCCKRRKLPRSRFGVWSR